MRDLDDASREAGRASRSSGPKRRERRNNVIMGATTTPEATRLADELVKHLGERQTLG